MTPHPGRPPEVRVAEWAAVEQLIRRVPQYADGRRVTIRPETVAPGAVAPLCLLVRSYRLDEVVRLIAGMDQAGIPLFRGVRVGPGPGGRLVPPPIVEVHAGRHVLIDGHHRLWHALQRGPAAVEVAVVRGDLERLPADVLTWEDVRLIDRHTPRAEKFRHLDEQVFRRIREYVDTPPGGAEAS